jgi:pilus assembly protein CpaE
VLLVLQQSLLAVNDAVRLKSLLIDEVGVPAGNIISVVNRHSKRAMLEMRDLTEAIGGSEPTLIPNQYQVASECTELGVFLAERAPNTPISKALAALQARVMGVPLQRERSLLSRIGLRG